MQFRHTQLLAAGAVAGTLVLSVPGWSQYNGAYGTQWNNPVSAQISVYLQNNMQAMQLRNALVGQLAMQNSLEKRPGKGKAPGKPTKSPAPKPGTRPVITPAPVAGGNTTFKAIPARVLPAKIARQYGKTPEEQKKLEGLVHQVINSWETQALSRQGLSRFNELWDLSKAIPYAVAVSHGVWRGNGAPPSREMIQATQRTLGDRLRHSPDVAKMSDLQKQEIYEIQALMTTLLESGREAAVRSRDLDGEKKIQEMAGKFLTAMIGESPDKIEISNQGFELRK